MDNYKAFLIRKTQLGTRDGFRPTFMPDCAFDFQRALIEWAVEQGRAALFEDCGMGKTLQQLAWAENVVRHTNRPVLILTPLAVSTQTLQEADRLGIEAMRSQDGKDPRGIVITNYERLHNFDWQQFAGCVCDESSILKSFDGTRRQQITEFMRKLPYRLLATATAAPNDYTELGTSSEALGYLGHMDMLTRFFKNDQNSIKATRSRRFEKGNEALNDGAKWRFKGHAELQFWRWVCSWARACRKPSDLGFDDGRFNLPELREVQHVVEARKLADGMLFALPAIGLKEQREERRRTIVERCERVAELVAHGEQSVSWCHLNDEGDLLERLIPGAIQVSGKDSDEAKEEKLNAFTNGEARVLVTKQSIAGWGLNWQNCHRMTAFPSHSFEAYYQGVRRCWRFGQTKPVTVDIVTTEGEASALKSLQRKQAAADKMFERLVAEMNSAIQIDHSVAFTGEAKMPAWVH